MRGGLQTKEIERQRQKERGQTKGNERESERELIRGQEEDKVGQGTLGLLKEAGRVIWKGPLITDASTTPG